MIRTILTFALCASFGCSIIFDAEPATGSLDIDASGSALNIDADTGGEGGVLGPVVNVTTGSHDTIDPQIVWNDTTLQVVWQQNFTNSSQLWGAIIAGDDIGDPIQLVAATASSASVAAIWSGTNLVLAWLSGTSIPYDLDGGLFEDTFSASSAPQSISGGIEASASEPSLVRTSTQIGAAWGNWAGATSSILVARLDSKGAPIGVPSTIATDGMSPSLAFSGSNYALAWRDVTDANSNILVRRLSATGTATSDAVTVSTSDYPALTPTIIAGSDGFGIVWAEVRDSNRVVLFSRFTSQLLATDPIVLSAPENEAGAASLVWNGNGFGAAWHERRDGQIEIIFQELDESGVALGSPTQLSEGTGNSNNPSLTYTGTQYGVVWHKGAAGARIIQYRSIQ